MSEFTLTSKLGKGRTFTVDGVGFAVEERDYEYVHVDGKAFSLVALLRSAGMEVSSEWVAEEGEAKKYRIRIEIYAEPTE